MNKKIIEGVGGMSEIIGLKGLLDNLVRLNISQDMLVYRSKHISLYFNSDNVFLTPYVNMIKKEYDNWLVEYQIPEGLEVNTVFDVGCDCGSTMLFFDREYGVKEFIICDNDKSKIDLAFINAVLNNWMIDDYFDYGFNVNMLFNTDFDLMKMDIEGGEKVLTNYMIDFPLIVEVHSVKLKKVFLEKGFKIVRQRNKDVCTMNNLEAFI